MNLKDKTKTIRLALKLTQREFAKIIGSNQTEVSFIPEDVKKLKS